MTATTTPDPSARRATRGLAPRQRPTGKNVKGIWKLAHNPDLACVSKAELAARIAVLELDNFKLVQRAELVEEELKATQARERYLLCKLRQAMVFPDAGTSPTRQPDEPACQSVGGSGGRGARPMSESGVAPGVGSIGHVGT